MDNRDVLLVVDMITDWGYEGAESVAEGAQGAIESINRLRDVDSLRTVYANDLSGGFHGSRESAFALALAGRHPELVAPLEPEPEEEFIHKGQHSAFYGTPLAHLLETGDVDEVILTGQVTEQCVIYTALDAHVRGYDITVATDAVLSQHEHLGEAALEMMEQNMGAKLASSREILDRFTG